MSCFDYFNFYFHSFSLTDLWLIVFKLIWVVFVNEWMHGLFDVVAKRSNMKILCFNLGLYIECCEKDYIFLFLMIWSLDFKVHCMFVMIFLNPYALACGSSLCYLLIMNDCCNVYRYQRVSPDCVPLSNGKKPNGVENGRSIPNGFSSTSTNFETKAFRFRSPSRNQDHHNNSTTSPPHSDNSHNHTQRHGTSPSPSPSRVGNGDVLLQWGQKKRARVSRSEIRAFPDESSSSGQARQPINKIPRRVDNKLSPSSMPPPPPPPSSQQQSTSTNTRGGNLKKENSGILSHRYFFFLGVFMTFKLVGYLLNYEFIS